MSGVSQVLEHHLSTILMANHIGLDYKLERRKKRKKKKEENDNFFLKKYK